MKGLIIIILFLIGNASVAQKTKAKGHYASDTTSVKFWSSYETDTIYVNGDELHWSSRYESGAMPYEVEQYLWGRWTKIGEVMGIGTRELNKYSIHINFHTGLNLFRLRQRDSRGGLGRFSISAKHIVNIEEAEYTIDKSKVKFNKMTFYVIRKDDETIKRAFGNTIDISDLNKGKYFLSFGEITKKIKIK